MGFLDKIKNPRRSLQCRQVQKKKERVLGLLYRLVQGESISPKSAAEEYGVSGKSIARDLNEIKNFLANNREAVGNADLIYIPGTNTYTLELRNCLLPKELLVIMKIMIGSRAVEREELTKLTDKLKGFTARADREILDKLIQKEIFHYRSVKHECENLVDVIWKLTGCIHRQKEITVSYTKMNGDYIQRRLQPLSILFSEYYFYLIAASSEKKAITPHYYRIDRITGLIEHRESFRIDYAERFDEGDLRRKIQLMFPGSNRTVKFEFSGPSVQAILDRLPTARILEKREGVYVIEAETYGTGINMFLLSQGAWVKVLEPKSFVEEMKSEIARMCENYSISLQNCGD